MQTTTTKKMSSCGSEVVLKTSQKFDSDRMRHYLNGRQTVLHCHHYLTLFTQMAWDAENFNGPKLLIQSSAETFYSMLWDYYKKNRITEICDRISIAEQYFRFVGLGSIRFEFWGRNGLATMPYSHIDEGWMKKWGQAQKRVNFIGQGYIQAACAAIFDLRSPDKINVEETQSIVCGASTSSFTINW